MPKPSHKEVILNEGLKVVHAQGYAGASVRDIVRAAGVPQGSFTNHFPSKEAFGLAIVDRYFIGTKANLENTLLNDSLPAVERFASFLDANINLLRQEEMHSGCLYGNFAVETSAHSPLLRERILSIFAEIEYSISYCLKAAAASGQISSSIDCDEMAAFMISSLQGAQLMVKLQENVTAMERLKKVFLTSLLDVSDS